MDLRREFTLSIGLLAVLNLALAFGAVGLLTRMGPAIERIMRENIYSIEAAEEILIELSSSDIEPLAEGTHERALDALRRAEDNVTEDGETVVLESIREALPAAFAKDPAARRRLTDDIQELIRINREAMRRVDGEASRLGEAGAWAVVVAGVLSFLLTLIIVVRLHRRFAVPLASIHHVLESALGGDRLRRCRSFQGPVELVQVGHAVNKLLDERQQNPGVL